MKIGEYAKLTRFDKPAGGLLLLWPTMWGLWLAAEGFPGWRWLGIFIVGVWVMRAFGCAVNDMADWRFDAQVRRTQSRPLAAQTISQREAAMVAGFFLLLALCLWWLLPPLAKQWALVALAVACIYPFAKRVMATPQIVLSAAFSFGIPIAYAAVRSAPPPPEAWGFVVVNILWVLAYDTIYAMCDSDDDKRIGLNSTVLWLGRYDVLAVGLCYAAAVVLLSALGLWLFPSALSYQTALLAAMAVVFRCWLLCRSRHLQQCMLAFRLNHWFGAFVWAGLAAVFV